MDYVAAARTMGAGNATIMCRVILPNAIPPLVIVATLTISSAILFESGLSFLGLGDPNNFKCTKPPDNPRPAGQYSAAAFFVNGRDFFIG